MPGSATGQHYCSSPTRRLAHNNNFGFVSLFCRHDYLSVHNGSSLSAPMIGKYCGSQTPFSVMSTVSSLFMMFRSDSSLNYKGFNATYELIGG